MQGYKEHRKKKMEKERKAREAVEQQRQEGLAAVEMMNVEDREAGARMIG